MAVPQQEDQISRALGYPYARPKASYLFTGGKAEDLPPDISLEDRIPVLACGSNGAPEQLCRKYGDSDTVRIPVTAATLDDIACTYSAHFTAYGSISAGLSIAPGTRSNVHITWLMESELLRMHETEALGKNYRFAELEEVSLSCSVTGLRQHLFAYISLRGSLLLEGAPVMLAGIPAGNPAYESLSQREMQSLARDWLAPGLNLHAFIRQNIENAGMRADRTAALAKSALHFTHPHIKTLLPERHLHD